MEGWSGGLRRVVPAGVGPLLLSAVLLTVAFPPFHLVVPSLVGLVPLAVWIEGRGRTGKEALRGGLVFGLVLWLLLLRWVPVTLLRFFPGALGGWVLAVVALGSVTAGVVWLAHHLRHRSRAPLWLALPLAWTAGEWLRAHLPGSLSFPWLDLGTSLAGHPELVGAAEWVGSRGVGFGLALANGLFATAWLTWREGSRPTGPFPARPADGPVRGWASAVGPAVLAGALLALPAAWGVHRAGTLETRPALTVAVLQTAVPLRPGAPGALRAEAGMEALERLLPRVAAIEGSAPDVVVLPEALLPVALEGPDAASVRERLETLVRRVGVPVLVGAVGMEGGTPHNSVFLVDPHGGVSRERYDKRHLVPLVERVPLVGGGGDGRWGSYGFGRSAEPLPVGGVRLGVLICWESSFPRAARALRRAGADALVNVTNDAWLNARSPWFRTSALRQHPAHLVMRAVETRTGAARAANTGLSLFVDPVGRVRQVVPPFREGVEIGTVHGTPGETVYVRRGDLVGPGALVLAVLLALLSMLRGAAGSPSGGGDAESRSGGS